MTPHQTAVHVIPAREFVEGGGFVVHRPFPVPGLSHVDPFLLIDEMGPAAYGPHEAVGAPDHPHRGFETVTYMLEGTMEHEDSFGHRGRIEGGDVQWMTAGAGVIHSEMPSHEILERGGRMHGFQIWINLPRSRKMAQPRYQEYAGSRFPVVERDGVWLRVIAGSVDGQASPIETALPLTMVHAKLAAGASASVPVAPGSNVVGYCMTGAGTVSGASVMARQVAVIEGSPALIDLTGDTGGLELLLLGGTPIREPVERYGPFVMSTREELETAFADYRAGRFGQIARTS